MKRARWLDAELQAVLLLGAALLCTGCRERKAPASSAATPTHSAEPSAAATPPELDAVRPFDDLTECRVNHRGVFIDLGSRASDARRSFQLGPFSDRASAGWADESYTRFFSRQAEYDFWLREPTPGLSVRLRARAGGARRLLVGLDQQRLATLELNANTFQVKILPPERATLERGRHTLSLRWLGPTPAEDVPYGMVEWIHLSPATPALDNYAPPQPRALWGDVVLGGKPKRALILGSPASVSCPLEVGRNSRLELSLGYWGDGAGVAQIFAEREGQPAVLLGEQRVQGGAEGAWQELSFELDGFASQLVHLELRAQATSASGRLAFAEPKLVLRRAPQARMPEARLGVLVVLSGVSRELLPPENPGLRALNRLAGQGVRFPQYRVPSTLVGSVFGTLLTGLPPLAHTIDSPHTRLPKSVPTLADAVAGKSGQTAFFTGVPHTFEPFGFARGFNHFEVFSPVNDVAASAPIERASEWLKRELALDHERVRLLVVHARGGHPPWDLSRAEVAGLPPDDYHGLLEARRGGITLAEIRSRDRLARRRLTAPDWTRLRALSTAALDKQDRALDELMHTIERAGEWDRTLFIVLGDIGMGEPPEAPYGQGRPLSEAQLMVPLLVKFPGAPPERREQPNPVTSVDVALTLAQALGLPPPDGAVWQDLYDLGLAQERPAGYAFLATLGRAYSTRYNRWVLSGQSPAAPSLCELDVDPACASDVLGGNPRAAEALWRKTFHEYQRQSDLAASAAPQPAQIDKDTAAALQVFGD